MKLKTIIETAGIFVILGLVGTGVYFGVRGFSSEEYGTIIAITNYSAPANCFFGQCGTIPQAQLRIVLQDESFLKAVSDCQNYWHLNDIVHIERTVRFFSYQIVMHDRNDPSGVVGQCGSLRVVND